MPEINDKNDPIIALCIYWLRADLMHTNIHEMLELFDDNLEKLHQMGAYTEFETYLWFWLGGLYIVVEGFEKLGLFDPNVSELIKKNRDKLRILRNNVFHFEEDAKKRVQALINGIEKLNWAEELHGAFEEYFSEYVKVAQDVQNIIWSH